MTDNPRQAPHPASHAVAVNGIRLRYADWGGDGAPMLLLHGDMRTGRSWDAVARRLSDRFRVIAPDARGHGDSDWTQRGYRFAERAQDLAAFCDALGLRDAIGVGHSTGGVVMTLCAQRRPRIFGKLTLLEPMLCRSNGNVKRQVADVAQSIARYHHFQHLGLVFCLRNGLAGLAEFV